MSFAALLAAADRAATGILGGVSIRYAPSALAGELYVDVQGIFDEAYIRADVGEAGVSSVSPAAFVRLEDLGEFDPRTDDDPAVTIGGVVYRVREAKPDGQGGMMLFLQERT